MLQEAALEKTKKKKKGFADDLILYRENSKEHQKLLEKINRHIKFAGYPTAYASEAFISTNNKLSEKKKLNDSIYNSFKKYLGISLNKEVNDMYTKICKTFIRKRRCK